MAGFKAHIITASVVATISTILTSNFFETDVNTTIILWALVVIGTTFPDLDSDHSIPIQYTHAILSLLLPVFVVYMHDKYNFLGRFGIEPSNQSLIGLFVASFILFFLLFKTALILTKHRGIFHSVPMSLFSALLVAKLSLWFLGVTQYTAFLMACAILIGFLTHLFLDEFWSVIRLKSSFGTACKLYDKNNILGTLFLYVGAAFLAYDIDVTLYF